jgi:hypothetical protein
MLHDLDDRNQLCVCVCVCVCVVSLWHWYIGDCVGLCWHWYIYEWRVLQRCCLISSHASQAWVHGKQWTVGRCLSFFKSNIIDTFLCHQFRQTTLKQSVTNWSVRRHYVFLRLPDPKRWIGYVYAQRICDKMTPLWRRLIFLFLT